MDTSNDSQNYDNPSSSNAGPHDSNIANKADPRVDSDDDHRNNVENDTSNDHNADPSRYKNTIPGGGTGQKVESLVDAVAGPPENASDTRQTSEPTSSPDTSSNTETRLVGDK